MEIFIFFYFNIFLVTVLSSSPEETGSRLSSSLVFLTYILVLELVEGISRIRGKLLDLTVLIYGTIRFGYT
jgi:hypothetical protein